MSLLNPEWIDFDLEKMRAIATVDRVINNWFLSHDPCHSNGYDPVPYRDPTGKLKAIKWAAEETRQAVAILGEDYVLGELVSAAAKINVPREQAQARVRKTWNTYL